MLILKRFRPFLCVLEVFGLTAFHVEPGTYNFLFYRWHKVFAISLGLFAWVMLIAGVIFRSINEIVNAYSVYERLLFTCLDIGAKVLLTVSLLEILGKRSKQIEIWQKLNEVDEILKRKFQCEINYGSEVFRHYVDLAAVLVFVATIIVSMQTILFSYKISQFRYVYLVIAILVSSVEIRLRYHQTCFYMKMMKARIELLNSAAIACLTSNASDPFQKLPHVRKIYLLIHAISKLICHIISFTIIVCYYVDFITMLFGAYFGILYVFGHAIFSHASIMCIFGASSFIHIVYLTRLCNKTTNEASTCTPFFTSKLRLYIDGISDAETLQPTDAKVLPVYPSR